VYHYTTLQINGLRGFLLGVFGSSNLAAAGMLTESDGKYGHDMGMPGQAYPNKKAPIH